MIQRRPRMSARDLSASRPWLEVRQLTRGRACGPALPQGLRVLPSGTFSGLLLPASLQGVSAGMTVGRVRESDESIYGK